MAKLPIIHAAVLAFTLAMAAEASVYRTTITTSVLDQMGGQYMQQIQQQRQQLQHCQRYLSSPFDAVLNIALNTEDDQMQQHLMQCCQALRNTQGEQCRCEAVREAMMMMGQQEMQQHMMQKARYLPNRCNLGPQQCHVRI